uniref:Uncharacterized protein n=1 Tax=Anguilla anguilla TaxID=7936 RepID=A0A0E9RKF0_ANGAN
MMVAVVDLKIRTIKHFMLKYLHTVTHGSTDTFQIRKPFSRVKHLIM